LPSSPYVIRMIKWSRTKWEGHVARMGGRKGGVHIGDPKVKTSLRRPRRRCENNIKMDFEKIGWV
jgi:hypothetical protein